MAKDQVLRHPNIWRSSKDWENWKVEANKVKETSGEYEVKETKRKECFKK